MSTWTRDDLPGVHWPGIHGESERQGAEKALDAVVDHLNTHHPRLGIVPGFTEKGTAAIRETLDRLVDERDEWRRVAAEQTRLERDRAEKAEAERDEAQLQRDMWKASVDEAPRVTRDQLLNAVHGNETGIYGIGQAAAVTDTVCRLFGIPAEQTTDPVEEKARELAQAGGIDFDEQEPDGVEMLIGMARHVLGGKNGA